MPSKSDGNHHKSFTGVLFLSLIGVAAHQHNRTDEVNKREVRQHGRQPSAIPEVTSGGKPLVILILVDVGLIS